MFSIICILAAIILAAKSCKKYRLAAIIVASEFILHECVYILGVQEPFLYLCYSFLNLTAILLLSHVRSHFVISSIIFMNLCYNVLTISQYSFYFYDFYGYYAEIVGGIMILELLYLAGITDYVYRRAGLLKNDGGWRGICSASYRRNYRGLL